MSVILILEDNDQCEDDQQVIDHNYHPILSSLQLSIHVKGEVFIIIFNT